MLGGERQFCLFSCSCPGRLFWSKKGRGCSCRQTQHAGLVLPLPSLPQGHKPIMTILQVFQMERSDFSAPILGTALPLWMINSHHLSCVSGSEHPHQPVPQLSSRFLTACLSGLSTSVPCKGLGTSYPSSCSRSAAVVRTTQCLFCSLAPKLPCDQAGGLLPWWLPSSLPCLCLQGLA